MDEVSLEDFDENGKVIKKQNIREVHIKRCIEALS